MAWAGVHVSMVGGRLRINNWKARLHVSLCITIGILMRRQVNYGSCRDIAAVFASRRLTGHCHHTYTQVTLDLIMSLYNSTSGRKKGTKRDVLENTLMHVCTGM